MMMKSLCSLLSPSGKYRSTSFRRSSPSFQSKVPCGMELQVRRPLRDSPSITYGMNILQNLPAAHDWSVTLNDVRDVRPRLWPGRLNTSIQFMPGSTAPAAANSNSAGDVAHPFVVHGGAGDSTRMVVPVAKPLRCVWSL